MTISDHDFTAAASAKALPLASVPAEPSGTRAQRKGTINITQVNLPVHLRKIPLLAGLSDNEMARVTTKLQLRQYACRDVILHKGVPGDSLLFLLAGQLQVIDVTEEGRAIGLRMLKPGDFCGEIAVINGSTCSASVVALSSVLVAFLPRATALHLFSHCPSVANQLLRHLAEKVQRDSEFRKLLGINNTSRRIYTYLGLLSRKDASNVEVVENLPTHQDIASIINTSRETVTRALLALAQQGIIEKKSKRLVILKPELLRKLAQGDA